MVATRLAVVAGRAVFVTGSALQIVDVERASGGSLSSDPMQCFALWPEVCQVATSLSVNDGVAIGQDALECPVPRPRQLFAVGINYKAHAAEMKNTLPAAPLVFTKFQSSLNRPNGEITLVGERCDWEAELVAVISTGGRDISVSDAWSHVAGLCVGQDISDRTLQYSSTPPQFSLGKSRVGFAPIGPWVTDVATLAGRDDLEMSCRVSGEVMQHTRTNDMIFDVPEIVSYLSGICELFPGDVIYTGTPSGVGAGRTPPRFLRAGDVIETTIQHLGTLTNRCK